MTSETLVTIVELITMTLVTLVISMIVSPVSAMVALLFSPVVIAGAYLSTTIQFKRKGGRMNNMSEKIDDFQAANALLQDVIINYRTVISFGQGSVDELTKNFDKLLTGPIEERKAKHKKTGFYFGIVLSSRSIYFAK